MDLVALAITSQRAIGESRLSAVVAARLNSALDHIKVRFRDPALSVTAVARVMGISPGICTGCWRHPERLLANVSTNCGCSKRSCC